MMIMTIVGGGGGRFTLSPLLKRTNIKSHVEFIFVLKNFYVILTFKLNVF